MSKLQVVAQTMTKKLQGITFLPHTAQMHHDADNSYTKTKWRVRTRNAMTYFKDSAYRNSSGLRLTRNTLSGKCCIRLLASCRSMLPANLQNII